MDKELDIQNKTLKGISVSNGIGIGKAIIYRTDLDDVVEQSIEADQVEDEIARYKDALNEVGEIFLSNQKRIAKESGMEQAKIFDTYQLILEDPFFKEEVTDAIYKELKNPEFIICSKLEILEKHFATIKDEYLRERIFDIRGVSRRLIYNLLQHHAPDPTRTGESNIIIARELTPADSIHFHHKSLKGIVTEFGGSTSHAAILARSLGVPAIVGVKNLIKNVENNSTVIIDGEQGLLIVNPDEEQTEFYKEQKISFSEKKDALISTLNKPIDQFAGRKIRLFANINEQSEYELAEKYNTEGVGLFRTELQFIAKERILSEEEQFEIYKNLLTTFKGKEVSIRVLDIGGDKFLPFTNHHPEHNPFLGWRSIRILLDKPDLFKNQLRAIYRASAFGNAKILIPMITSREELLSCKRYLQEVQNNLKAEKIKFNPNIPIGIMVEIPSAAIMIEDLLDQVDFVSIGTNDLIQYTLAVDRNNEKVAHLYQPLNLAVLKLIKMVVEACNKKGKEVSVCGEMAGDPKYTQILLALGVNDFSMQPVSIPAVKNIMFRTNKACLENINSKIGTLTTALELEKFLAETVKVSCSNA